MPKKFIVFAYFIILITFALSGCSDSQSIKNTNENSSEKSGSITKLSPSYIASQNKTHEAIAKVLEDHPEFPDKAGTIEREESLPGGPKPEASKVTVKYETKIDEKSNSTYTITLTKTWGITVNGKTLVSYWKYNITSTKVNLVDKSTKGEDLVNIIK